MRWTSALLDWISPYAVHQGAERCASATEIALKMSAHYWRNRGRPAKNRFIGLIGLAGGYHGESVGALAVTDVPLVRASFSPLVRLESTRSPVKIRDSLLHRVTPRISNAGFGLLRSSIAR
jgi:adenosylmethionine-8-amino-7-oxononanoate aminotransferase